jgi:nicotinate phosphoribosyltransferase
MSQFMARHSYEPSKFRTVSQADIGFIEPLLEDVLKEGKLVYDLPDIAAMRARRDADLERLDEGVKRLLYPHIYHVSLTQPLWELKQRLIEEAMSQTHKA